MLIDGVNEIVCNEFINQKGRFLGALLASLPALSVQPVIFSIVKDISGRGVRRAERRYMYQNFMFISILYESNFHSVFPRKDLPRLKDVANVINLCDKNVTKHMVSALILLEFNSIP